MNPLTEKLFHMAGYPVHVLANVIHHKKSPIKRIKKEHTKYVIGGSFMLVGSSAAVLTGHIEGLPLVAHIAIDGIAYAIHGCGTVPFITHIVKKLNLEEGKIEYEIKSEYRREFVRGSQSPFEDKITRF